MQRLRYAGEQDISLGISLVYLSCGYFVSPQSQIYRCCNSCLAEEKN